MARTEHVEYLVMVPNYWGIGDTIDDAVEQLIAAGGYITDGFTLLRFKPETIFQSVHPVHGEVSFSSADGESVPEAPSSTVVIAADAIIFRRAAIKRSLVSDDLDAFERENLKEEFDALYDDLEAIAAH
jgi:hypothetical protein